MNRRSVIKNCLLSSGALIGHSPMKSLVDHMATQVRSIRKTDTHVHLFDLTQIQYSWLKKVPEINRTFTVADFKRASRRSNVSKILFMESGADTGYSLKEVRWVTRLAQKEARIKGIIAKVNLSDVYGTSAFFEALDDLPLIRGIRGSFPEDAAQSKEFMTGLDQLKRRDLTFDLLLPAGRLSDAAQVARRCPGNRFIINHLGSPDIKKGDRLTWEKNLLKVAGLPNVICKISGAITRIGKEWTIDDIKPYILFAIEHFGVDRVVYGGDWPVVLLAGSYKSWSKAFEQITDDFSISEKQMIYHLNADRIYRLK